TDVVFVQANGIGDPETRRVGKQRIEPADLEVAWSTQREIDVANRLERHADDESQSIAARFDEGENRGALRDVVRVERRRAAEERQRGHPEHTHPCHSERSEESAGPTDSNCRSLATLGMTLWWPNGPL